VGIEIVEKNRHTEFPRAIAVLRDVDRSVVGQRPHRLGGSDHINAMRKYVVSSTLKDPEWPNTARCSSAPAGRTP
jgi:hypothetical protein